jgi:hypothetical protein
MISERGSLVNKIFEAKEIPPLLTTCSDLWYDAILAFYDTKEYFYG